MFICASTYIHYSFLRLLCTTISVLVNKDSYNNAYRPLKSARAADAPPSNELERKRFAACMRYFVHGPMTYRRYNSDALINYLMLLMCDECVGLYQTSYIILNRMISEVYAVRRGVKRASNSLYMAMFRGRCYRRVYAT